MTAIYYIDKKPFFCEELTVKGVDLLMNEKCTKVLLEHSVFFKKVYCYLNSNRIHIFLDYLYTGEDFFDISHYYKKIADNIEPIWIENDHGRQIGFLIEDNNNFFDKNPEDYMRENFPPALCGLNLSLKRFI